MEFSRPVADHRIQKALSILTISTTPASVAQSVNLSPSWLGHLFKAETGVPLRFYVVSKRLERAADLLQGTQMRVKEVAYCVGYGHPSSFVRAFIRHYGTTPQRFRLVQQQKMSTKSAQC